MDTRPVFSGGYLRKMNFTKEQVKALLKHDVRLTASGREYVKELGLTLPDGR